MGGSDCLWFLHTNAARAMRGLCAVIVIPETQSSTDIDTRHMVSRGRAWSSCHFVWWKVLAPSHSTLSGRVSSTIPLSSN